MDNFSYLSMTGAKHALQAQQHTSHNLANANTPGFRADLDQLVTQPVQGPGFDSRAYSAESSIGASFEPGPMRTTGRDMDVAVQGDGFIAVQGADGNEAYTRRGDLRVSSMGLLETGAGDPVMGENGPVAVPPADEVEIGEDGTISIVPPGGQGGEMAVIDRIKLVDAAPQNLEKGNDGLFRLADGGVAPADGAVRVRSGMLEGSNVNSVEAMVELIDNQRQFETNIKMLTKAEENDSASSQLLRLQG
ncbi:flagellar basal-body rod protein FlgF [Aquisalimonas lutea]|uniref:flagellar basal-body rod protein FlgF n=1 Tax=Aquisalimonas lutea TaxID=1327750 RepID=UPI0025B39892|nr:flagellar basal-body rod protein FlgF [Aquisalimonas lutea]MDN3517985.1 flagellar basal-body rod protein FlgF [Aquisalimonas lutea]